MVERPTIGRARRIAQPARPRRDINQWLTPGRRHRGYGSPAAMPFASVALGPLSDAGRPTGLQVRKAVRNGACQVPDARNAWLCSRVVPGKEGFFSLTEQNDRRPQMLKTLMISAAVSALTVSGALAQADMSP